VTSPAALINQVWNYAHVLRDDGVSYGDYVERLQQGHARSDRL
jgi:type I restriction enzyme M protein